MGTPIILIIIKYITLLHRRVLFSDLANRLQNELYHKISSQTLKLTLLNNHNKDQQEKNTLFFPIH